MPDRRLNAVALVAVLALAAVLRFATLDARGFWGDELSTVFLVRDHFGSMLSSIGRLESTPPLYYSLAWIWAKVFGTSEAGMRSLPALLGVATVPMVHAAARLLVSRRAALFAAVLVAVNPLLVWYSQEARSYSLLAFLSASGLYWFARALRDGRGKDFAGWAVVSGLALATHYFAGFLVMVEAVVLVRARHGGRALVAALGLVGASGALLVPVMLHQRALDHVAWVSHPSLAGRVVSVPAQFTVGFDEPMPLAMGVVGTLLAAVGAVLLLKRVGGRDRHGAKLAAALCLAAIAVPVGLALVGFDYFNARNALAALLPAMIALAAGYSVPGARLGQAAGGLLVALSIAVVITIAGQPKFRSEDWRAAAADLAPPTSERALVAAPGQAGRKPLEYYLGASPIAPTTAVRVREVDVVVMPRQGQSRVPKRDLARLLDLSLPGFVRTGSHVERDFALVSFRSRLPVTVFGSQLQREVQWGAPRVLVQNAPGGTRLARSSGAGGGG